MVVGVLFMGTKPTEKQRKKRIRDKNPQNRKIT
jgi:G:T/U-mismatch repair DNA glycosylase